MTDPGPVGFSSSSEKKLEYGWSRMDDDDQFFERLTRNVLEIDAQIHHQFAFDPDGTHQLRFAYFGGMYDDGAAWQLAPNGTLTLPDNTATIYIERGLATGLVSFNLIGFTYGAIAPIAMVTTANGEVVDVLDRRPHDTGAGGGGGGGCTTFVCLTGQILDAQVPSSAVTQHNADLDHGLLEPVSLTHDDHLQYLLLAGRAGGQTAYGGTGALDALTLQGSSNASLGTIQVKSPIISDYDFTVGAIVDVLRWNPVIPSSGGNVASLIRNASNITVDNALFIFATLYDQSNVEWVVNPGFAVSTLFLAQPQYITTTPGISPAQSFILAAQPAFVSNGAGAATVNNFIAVNVAASLRTLQAGDGMTVTNYTGVNVGPIWGTVGGSSISFGTIRGVHCRQPAKGIFYPGAGSETMAAYYGLEFDNITFGGTAPRAAVRSSLASGTNRWFLLNASTAPTEFGSSNVHWNDNVWILLGQGGVIGDIGIRWNNAQSVYETFFASFADSLYWSCPAANRFLLSSNATAANELNMDFTKFSFGQASAVGNQVGVFVAQARTVGVPGGWADFLLTQAGNLDINGFGMSDVFAWTINAPSIVDGVGGGSILHAGGLFVGGNVNLGTNRYGVYILSNPSGGTLNYSLRTAGPTRIGEFLQFDERLDANTTLVTGVAHNAGNEHVILVDDDTAGAAVTVTLPLAATSSAIYHIKKLGTTANVIIDGNGAETIDGALTVTLTVQYASIMVISDGSNWHVI